MFPKIKEIVALDDYRLRLRYTDGAEGVFDFEKTVGFSGVFEKLRDQSLFRKARISRDGWKTLSWPGRLDLDPVVLYSRVTGKSIEWIMAQKEPKSPSRRRSVRRVRTELGENL